MYFVMIEEKKDEQLRCITSPIQKEKIKIVVLSILNVLVYTQKFLSYSCLQIAFFPKCQSPQKNHQNKILCYNCKYIQDFIFSFVQCYNIIMLLPEILLCSFYLSENKKINKPDLLCYGSLSTSQIVKLLRSFSKDSPCNLFFVKLSI